MKRSAQTLLAASLTLFCLTGTVMTPTLSTAAVIQSPEVCNFAVYLGDTPGRGQLLSNSKILVPNESGSVKLNASEPGKWKVINKESGQFIDHLEGSFFETVELAKGTYIVEFTPDSRECVGSWQATLLVSPVELFQGQAGSEQKVTPEQHISAQPGQSIRFSSNMPGKWSIGGLDQKVFESSLLELVVPSGFEGKSLPVQFDPNGGDDRAGVQVFVDVAGQAGTCSPQTSAVTMDVVAQINASSTPTLEKVKQRSNSTIKLYQNPVNQMWLTTDSERLLNGSLQFAEWEPGIWSVNNVVATDNRLNWNHTALDVGSFGKGTYKVTYTSKQNPERKWCGQVQLIESAVPKSGASTCERLESGEAPSPQPLQVKGQDGTELTHNGTISFDSDDQMKPLRSLQLFGTHAVYHGTKTLKTVKRAKTNVRTVTISDVRWQHEQLAFGEDHTYPGGLIRSKLKAEVYYDGDTLLATAYSRKDRDGETSDGDETLNLQKIIANNGNKPGTYTLKIVNELSYRHCQVVAERDESVKVTDMKSVDQTFVTHVVVKP